MEIKHKKVEPRFNTFTSDFISFFVNIYKSNGFISNSTVQYFVF